MDSYYQPTPFPYNPMEDDTQFSGILEIYIHHARNIHNICIYDDQDVYAKFSLTYNPDETFSTSVINGGGKNPEFNEKLSIKVGQFDAVLKCEMWMLSRVKSFMEDQLLGFSLVPVSLIEAGELLTRDFSLSSTDLFHSPVGTVRLTLSLNTNLPSDHTIVSTNLGSSIMSEVVLLDPVEYSRFEFPDINVVTQNQQMVSEYFGESELNKSGLPTFLCLVDSNIDAADKTKFLDSEFFSSATTGLISAEKLNSLRGESSESCKEVQEESEMMQQQIVDMYKRSMQQFTESLTNMKLPVNLEKINSRDDGRRDVYQPENLGEMKNGGRVYYGSRAFF